MAKAIEYPDNTIPVTLMRGRPWYSEYLSWELCNILNALEQPDLRIIGEGAVKKVGLDGRSRARDDNQLNLPKEEKRRITARKINKGLTMEMVMSSLLTFVDPPGAVTSRCVPNKRGLPNNFAQGGRPDIVFHPADNEPSFQVVCEVSANEEMDDSTYLGQLETGLEHARKDHQKARVAVTYLFVANLRKIGEEKALQAVYRKFLAAPGSRLAPMGTIRPVPMRVAEFGRAARILDHEYELAFNSQVLAKALDALQQKMWLESVPEEVDWMSDLFVETVRRSFERERSLFDPETLAGPS